MGVVEPPRAGIVELGERAGPQVPFGIIVAGHVRCIRVEEIGDDPRKAEFVGAKIVERI